MHFYHLSWKELRKVPMKLFWLMDRNINRINAECDIRAIDVAQAGQGGDAGSHMRQILHDRLGQVLKTSPYMFAQRDQEGFNNLKSLALMLK